MLANVSAWAWNRAFGGTVNRSISFADGVRVVAVGGATFGGSGKTPLAIACAEELAAAGVRVALVGHAYRARPERARLVSAEDRLDQVGDEALLAARLFAGRAGQPPRAIPVVVAPRRADAISFAARLADVLVLDGVAQTTPVRAALALLALDGVHPWGRAQALPPRGDLRAPRATLIGACDAVVPILEEGAPITDDPRLPAGREATRATTDARPEARPALWAARSRSLGAWDETGSLLTWELLRSVRVGLLTALARPERVVSSLAARGVFPRKVLCGRDHGPIAAGAAIRESRWVSRSGAGPGDNDREGIDLWLATPKCALHARNVRLALPLATLDHSVLPHPLLCARLRALSLP